jgi:hypothetical protein
MDVGKMTVLAKATLVQIATFLSIGTVRPNFTREFAVIVKIGRVGDQFFAKILFQPKILESITFMGLH